MGSTVQRAANKSLQGTFDPLPIFAAAKTGIASNAPELRRYAAKRGNGGHPVKEWYYLNGNCYERF